MKGEPGRGWIVLRAYARVANSKGNSRGAAHLLSGVPFISNELRGKASLYHEVGVSKEEIRALIAEIKEELDG